MNPQSNISYVGKHKLHDIWATVQEWLHKHISSDIIKHIIKPLIFTLRCACILNDVELLKNLLQSDGNQHSGHQSTLCGKSIGKIRQCMKLAIKLQHTDILQYIVDAKFESLRYNNDELIYYANKMHNIEMIKYLMHKGLDINENCSFSLCSTTIPRFPGVFIRYALDIEDLDWIKYLIEWGYSVDHKYQTMIMEAAIYQKNAEMFLFFADFQPIILQKYELESMMDIAIRYDLTDILKLMFDKYKYDMNEIAPRFVANAIDNHKSDILLILCDCSIYCARECAKFLPDMCYLNNAKLLATVLSKSLLIPFNIFCDAMYYSVKHNLFKSVKQLIVYAEMYIPESNMLKEKYSAYLALACKLKYHKIFDALLNAGADLCYNDNEPLCLATYSGDLELFQTLVTHQVDVFCRKGIILTIAIEQNHISIIKYVLSLQNADQHFDLIANIKRAKILKNKQIVKLLTKHWIEKTYS